MTDLNRLLEQANEAIKTGYVQYASNVQDGIRAVLLDAYDLKALIERVKEAEKYKTDAEDFAAVVAALKTENETLESRLRAAEEVVKAARRLSPGRVFGLEDALRHYDEAVGRVKE